MKRIFSIIFLLFLCFHTSLMAQRTMNTLNNQFGSSASGLNRDQYDRNGNPIDTTAVVDASTIPIGLYSWKVDSRFGNVTYIPVDTLQHAFQNSNDMGGYTGQYNYLGNLGSPASHASFLTVGTPANTFSPTHTTFAYNVRKMSYSPIHFLHSQT
ncbi:hypothetical protein QNN11_08415 [Phocaeicola dorei]|uniref:Uncharacterized protein n=1 Tax=Phocaeicola dorei TaxID=357276 RepID=A0AA95KV81_9BACT|nr:hypothetical protein QNN11_08415 [Phocaeicola dorei]